MFAIFVKLWYHREQLPRLVHPPTIVTRTLSQMWREPVGAGTCTHGTWVDHFLFEQQSGD